MTFAMALKVTDGVVIAADSASSLTARSFDESGNPNLSIAQVYNNGNKVFNLVKGPPIGVCSWGLGAIGQFSIELLF